MIRIFFLFLFFWTLPAYANFSTSNYLGFFYTDNANLEKDQKDGDFYMSLLTSNTVSQENIKWRFRLGYYDYSKENQNDLLSGQVSGHYMITPGARSTEIYIKLLFQDYLASQVSGSTDTSYDFSGFELGAEYNFELENDKSLRLRPYYQQRNYANLNNRKDQQIGGALTLDKEWNEKTYFYADAELGFLSSNLSEYSKNFLLLGVGLDHKLNDDWNIESDFSLLSGTYTNRTTTQVVTGTSRRKGVSMSSETVPETTRTVVLNFSGIRKISEEFNFRTGWTLTNQSSRSGDESYSANIFYGQINYHF